MVTPFGKELRLLRLEKDQLLKEMADCLGVTPAYLSSIENGKRQPTDELINKLFSAYALSTEDKARIISAKNQTNREIRIDFTNSKPGSEELGLLFARKFDGLTDTQIQSLKEMLNRE